MNLLLFHYPLLPLASLAASFLSLLSLRKKFPYAAVAAWLIIIGMTVGSLFCMLPYDELLILLLLPLLTLLSQGRSAL